MSNFLYHMVPNNMHGESLIPLNQLRGSYPKVYKSEVRKYRGREALLEVRIPTLDCLWNDVVFLTAVHPDTVREAFRKAKVLIGGIKWFEIDPFKLDKERTTVYLYNDSAEREYVDFDPSDLNRYSQVSDETIQYYIRTFHGEGKNPFLFYKTPHILHKGQIDVKESRIIETPQL